MSSAPEISRANPASFLFLINQSGSMDQKLAGQAGGINKMNAAGDQVNRTIQAVAMQCSQGDEVRDYFHIGRHRLQHRQQRRSHLAPCPHRHHPSKNPTCPSAPA